MSNEPNDASLPMISSDELQELLDAATLDRLLAESPHAFYTVVEADEGPTAVVFRRLSTTEFKRVTQMVKDPRRVDHAADTAAQDIVLFPQGPALRALRDQCPGLTDRVVGLALRIAKGEMPEEAKKLRTSPARPRVGTSPSTPAR